MSVNQLPQLAILLRSVYISVAFSPLVRHSKTGTFTVPRAQPGFLFERAYWKEICKRLAPLFP